MRKTIRCPICGQPFPHGSARRPIVLRVGDLVLNPVTFDACRAGNQIALSRREFRLLEVLMRRSGCVVSRHALAHSIWEPNGDVDDNSIDVSVYQLQKKVDQDHAVKVIKAVRKLGYAIRDPAKTR